MGVKLAWGGYVTNIVTTSSFNRASRRREDGAGNLKGSFGVLRSPWVCHIKPDLCQKEEISVFIYNQGSFGRDQVSPTQISHKLRYTLSLRNIVTC